MTARRTVVHIGKVVIDAEPGADLTTLEVEIRRGLTSAFQAGPPPAFARNAPLLTSVHRGIAGVGTAIATATAPARRGS